jgi:methylmalonyl-CoA mutase
MIDEAMKYIDEVEKEGGMTKAIEAGIPKMRIEEAAAKKQAKIDSSEEFIIWSKQLQNSAETTTI